MLREQRFDAGTVEINYAEGPPSGPPCVVLHGGSASWQYGRAFLEALLDRWHVYAPDFRGHGKSGRVPGHYQATDYAADTAVFLAGVVGSTQSSSDTPSAATPPSRWPPNTPHSCRR